MAVGDLSAVVGGDLTRLKALKTTWPKAIQKIMTPFKIIVSDNNSTLSSHLAWVTLLIATLWRQ